VDPDPKPCVFKQSDTFTLINKLNLLKSTLITSHLRHIPARRIRKARLSIWSLGSLTGGCEVNLGGWEVLPSDRKVYLEAGKFTWRLEVLPSCREVYLEAGKPTLEAVKLTQQSGSLSGGWEVYFGGW
jgi:hypothetical protein